jgi:hypothetical protein
LIFEMRNELFGINLIFWKKKGLLESRPLFDFDLSQNYSAAGASVAAGAASAGAASTGAASTGAASGAACSVVVASGAATSSFLLQATARTIKAAARTKYLDIEISLFVIHPIAYNR